MMKMTFDLPPDIVQRLKIQAAKEGLKLKDLVSEAFRTYLAKPKGPNRAKSGSGPFPLFKGGHPAAAGEEIDPDRLYQILYGGGQP